VLVADPLVGAAAPLVVPGKPVVPEDVALDVPEGFVPAFPTVVPVPELRPPAAIASAFAAMLTFVSMNCSLIPAVDPPDAVPELDAAPPAPDVPTA
jgi:hypothetical protein